MNMFKKHPFASVLVGLVGLLVGLSLWQQQRIRVLEADQEAHPVRSVPPAALSVRPQGPHAPAAGGAMVSETAPEVSPASVKALLALRAQYEGPAAREARLREFREQAEARHMSLFRALAGLPPEQLDALRDALAQSGLDAMLAVLPSSSEETAEEASARLARVSSLQAEQDARARAVLGEEAYATYESYFKTLSYRESVAEVSDLARVRGVQLTDAQQGAVLVAYAAALGDSARANSATDTTGDAAAAGALRESQMDAFYQRLSLELSRTLEPDAVKVLLGAFAERDKP